MKPIEVDPDMAELLSVFSKAIVPRSRRRTVVRSNTHSTYYNDARYRYL
jgi:hypothetical protein